VVTTSFTASSDVRQEAGQPVRPQVDANVLVDRIDDEEASALARNQATFDAPSSPPAIRTRPSASSVAVWDARPEAIEPVSLNVPVAGSRSSARG
jgi:hypothetical protein